MQKNMKSFKLVVLQQPSLVQFSLGGYYNQRIAHQHHHAVCYYIFSVQLSSLICRNLDFPNLELSCLKGYYDQKKTNHNHAVFDYIL